MKCRLPEYFYKIMNPIILNNTTTDAECAPIPDQLNMWLIGNFMDFLWMKDFMVMIYKIVLQNFLFNQKFLTSNISFPNNQMRDHPKLKKLFWRRWFCFGELWYMQFSFGSLVINDYPHREHFCLPFVWRE